MAPGMKIETIFHGPEKGLIGHIKPRSPDGGRPHDHPDKGIASMFPYDFLPKDFAFPIVSIWAVVRVVAWYVAEPANVHGGSEYHSLDTRDASCCLDEISHSNRVGLVVAYAFPIEVRSGSQMENVYR